jgi:PBP1b-binding outer membrane lipoprotein LpoB
MMKKNIFKFIIIGLFINGCATWEGIKQDSSDAWETTKEKSQDTWNSTKEALEDATSK